MIDADDLSGTHLNAFACEVLPIARPYSARAIRAEDDVRRPGLQRQREAGTGTSTRDDSNRLVAMLPSVAVRTMVNSDAVTLLQARDIRWVIAYPGRDERDAGADSLVIVECCLEDVVDPRQLGHCRLTRFDAVSVQLLASNAKELQWRNPVPAQKAVQRR